MGGSMNADNHCCLFHRAENAMASRNDWLTAAILLGASVERDRAKWKVTVQPASEVFWRMQS